jgi:hypothetical protein
VLVGCPMFDKIAASQMALNALYFTEILIVYISYITSEEQCRMLRLLNKNNACKNNEPLMY